MNFHFFDFHKSEMCYRIWAKFISAIGLLILLFGIAERGPTIMILKTAFSEFPPET